MKNVAPGRGKTKFDKNDMGIFSIPTQQRDRERRKETTWELFR